MTYSNEKQGNNTIQNNWKVMGVPGRKLILEGDIKAEKQELLKTEIPVTYKKHKIL